MSTLNLHLASRALMSRDFLTRTSWLEVHGPRMRGVYTHHLLQLYVLEVDWLVVSGFWSYMITPCLKPACVRVALARRGEHGDEA